MSQEYPSNADDYSLLHAIGKGATASVWHAICVPLNKEVAIKIIDLENCPSNLDDIRKEIQLMKLCSHPNLVSYRSSFIKGHSLWLVMDYLSGGSIYDIMRFAFPNGLTDEALIATILHEALQGIAYLHSTGRIHRDVKASNLLTDAHGNIRVGDFGVSAWLIEEGMSRKGRLTFVGTPCWMAPEVMEQTDGYDYKADIWSLGITALELANGQAPLAKYPPMKVVILTLSNPPPTVEKNSFSTHFHQFVELCLNKDPQKRPTATKLLDHKFFKQVKKTDHVKQFLKNLPPLWERVCVEIPESEDEKSGDSKAPLSWNFESNGAMIDAVDASVATQPLNTTTAHLEEKPSAQSVTKGRFTKTVISKTPTPEKTEPDNTEVLVNPLNLLAELQKQILALMKENETLKAQNAKLKKDLATK